jgi:hypothetical protein
MFSQLITNSHFQHCARICDAKAGLPAPLNRRREEIRQLIGHGVDLLPRGSAP